VARFLSRAAGNGSGRTGSATGGRPRSAVERKPQPHGIKAECRPLPDERPGRKFGLSSV